MKTSNILNNTVLHYKFICTKNEKTVKKKNICDMNRFISLESGLANDIAFRVMIR